MRSIALILWISLSTTLLSNAQPSDCLPIHFMGGQVVRVIGSVDAGGLPFRQQPSLESSVEGFIPLDTQLQTKGLLRCSEERNWYSVFYSIEGEAESQEVWVVDGDSYTHWLEPVPICRASDIQIYPAYPSYVGGRLIVDGFDKTSQILRFSLDFFPEGVSRERHYFELDLATGFLTQMDYWYRDVITRDLTNQLGITDRVFGEEEGFNVVYVSPDKTQFLYRTVNPTIPNCAHGCTTETLWLADIDGSNPIALTEFYGLITHINWLDDEIQLSMLPIEVFGPNFDWTVCLDGSCDERSHDRFLEGHDLPFDHGRHTPTLSPNGEWIATSFGSEDLYLEEGILSIGVILNTNDNRYIQLPNNGEAASPILWINDRRILYPVIGTGWDGEPHGLPSDFYEVDALWDIVLDFDDLSYHVIQRMTDWQGREWDDRLFGTEQTHHIIPMSSVSRGVIVYNQQRSLSLHCFPQG